MSNKDAEDSGESNGSERRSLLERFGFGIDDTPNRRFEHKLSGMGRRRFLKTMSALGLSGAGIEYLTKDAVAEATGNPKDEVPFTAQIRLKNPERLKGGHPGEHLEMEPVIETMPRDRWVRIESAHKASKRLYRTLQQRFDDNSITVGVVTGDSGNKKLLVTRERLKHVPISDQSVQSDEIKAALPSTVSETVGNGKYEKSMTGMSVSFEEVGHEYFDYYSYDYNDTVGTPGGCEIEAVNLNTNKGSIGTVAQPVYNKDSSSYELLTAGHVLESRNKVYQPLYNGGDLLGKTQKVQNQGSPTTGDINGDGKTDYYKPTNVDAGTFSTSDYRYNLAGNGGSTDYDAQITGYWTWNKIKSEEDTGWQVTKQGTKTRRTSGDIFYTDSNRKWFATHATGDHGDSGGIIYRKDASGTANTAGVLSTGVDLGNDGDFDGVAGNSFDHILDSLNLWFN